MIDHCRRVISSLVAQHKTTDPVALANLVGIRIVRCKLPSTMRAYHIFTNTALWLFLNALLPYDAEIQIIAKTIGHHELHCTTGKVTEEQDKEAERFAELLLSQGQRVG